MPNIPTDLNTLSNEQIDALIKEMIDYYKYILESAYNATPVQHNPSI